jgi:hypothetical protein
MEEFERDLRTIRSFPVWCGSGKMEVATRAANAISTNEDVVKTMSHMYCDLPFSPLLRSVCWMSIQYFKKEIDKIEATWGHKGEGRASRRSTRGE